MRHRVGLGTERLRPTPAGPSIRHPTLENSNQAPSAVGDGPLNSPHGWQAAAMCVKGDTAEACDAFTTEFTTAALATHVQREDGDAMRHDIAPNTLAITCACRSWQPDMAWCACNRVSLAVQQPCHLPAPLAEVLALPTPSLPKRTRLSTSPLTIQLGHIRCLGAAGHRR